MAHVLVTGGSGFIASWCILELLQSGHTVRTTVRSAEKEQLLRQQLHAAADFDDARLTVVLADLQSDAGWADALTGCDYVLHVASPTLRSGGASEEEMIAVARGGVLRVLSAARDAGVRRVVLTSASGAIVYGHKDESRPFTEEDWTDVTADIAPYQKSKTLAERAAWQFIRDESGGLELAVVNPTAVIGPLLGPDDPPSLRTIRGMLRGDLPAAPPFGTGWVDVRDVADLHIRAMIDPAADGERFLAIAGRSLRVIEVARILRQRLGNEAAKAPTWEMPLLLARALSIVNPALRSLRPQLGHHFPATSAKAENLLGWRPRPIEDSIVDTAQSLLAHDAVGRDRSTDSAERR
ncbi:aldehyde reductase [Microbacterium sp. QXD-8]|uniref:Aldehyde reductase n=1 Tax=Microbacterium psychrotolerans TaxID=3068321 RepID=A0ABU0YZB2_9MICO|nr:aldehyde reductase [Microbacterium sp. QXD-8]MDQ7877677.1 aldehyde reductase [Microbacterium sp. QXD-8]